MLVVITSKARISDIYVTCVKNQRLKFLSELQATKLAYFIVKYGILFRKNVAILCTKFRMLVWRSRGFRIRVEDQRIGFALR